jgi:mono/diheme cytochrome c family protein
MKRMLIIAALALTACGADDKPAETPAAKPAAAKPAPAPAPAPKAEAKPAAANAVDGKGIYNQYCVACHGPDGKGNNGLAASYVDDPARLAQADDILIKSIKEGKQGDVGVMPPWGGTLNDEQITAVLGYIRAEFGGAPKADAKPE